MGELRDTERFDVTREIGRGGMGVVYEAVDRETGVPVALKSLRFVAPELILHLKNEFRALQDLYHPNLVTLGELVEDRGEWFFSMELIDGAALGDHIAAAPDPEREARLRSAIGQLAKGLNALHEFGKVHRDVKPSNVMVDRDGRVVILDFGLVTDLHADSGGDAIGSVAYMAPEQAAGGRVSPASDWYAFGVVLYELLAGELPFCGTPREIIEAKQGRRPAPLKGDAPVDLAALVDALLAFDPGERPGGGEVLLRLGVEDSNLLKVPEAAGSRGRGPFIGRHRELAALVAAFDETGRSRTVSVLVHGPSGVGKSALLDRFLDALPDTATVLRGRCYASANLRSGILNASWLAAGDPDTARSEAIESISRWSQDGFHMQHVSDLNANALIDLYVGDRAGAHRRVTAAWPRLRRSFLTTVEFIRVICHDLRGKVALAAAIDGDERAMAVARADLGRLLGEKVAWAHALGALLAAGIAAAEGDRHAAAEEYLAAAAELDAQDMAAHAAVARLRRAQLVAPERTAHEIELLGSRGIADPLRFAEIYAPA
jgi:hypothetical protein